MATLVERVYMKSAGGAFGVLVGLFTWSLPLAMERFRYMEPDLVDLSMDLGMAVVGLLFAAVVVWAVQRLTRDGVTLKEGQGIGGLRTMCAVFAMCGVAVVGGTWATVAHALYPFVTNVFMGGIVELVMLVTVVPPFLTGWLVGLRAGDYPFTILELREARAED